VEKQKIVLIIHDVRSSHNVGSMFRSADAFSVDEIILTGYTPYPAMADDPRMPHLAQKIDRQIKKTALGAEKTVTWKHETDIFKVIEELKNDKYLVIALEQSEHSLPLLSFSANKKKLAIIVGNEVEGVDETVLAEADKVVEIPQTGSKESLNVAVAAAIAIYHVKMVAEE